MCRWFVCCCVVSWLDCAPPICPKGCLSDPAYLDHTPNVYSCAMNKWFVDSDLWLKVCIYSVHTTPFFISLHTHVRMASLVISQWKTLTLSGHHIHIMLASCSLLVPPSTSIWYVLLIEKRWSNLHLQDGTTSMLRLIVTSCSDIIIPSYTPFPLDE